MYLLACQVKVRMLGGESWDIPLVDQLYTSGGSEFMYLVFTRMPGENYRKRLKSLMLCLCDVFDRQLTPLFADFVDSVFVTLFTTMVEAANWNVLLPP